MEGNTTIGMSNCLHLTKTPPPPLVQIESTTNRSTWHAKTPTSPNRKYNKPQYLAYKDPH